jgi:hypothetical protein
MDLMNIQIRIYVKKIIRSIIVRTNKFDKKNGYLHMIVKNNYYTIVISL